MTCCAPGEYMAQPAATALEDDGDALLLASIALTDGSRQLDFAVPDAHCGACINAIEASLVQLPMVRSARVNLSRRRVRIAFDPNKGSPVELHAAIERAGYRSLVLDQPDQADAADPVLRRLVVALAVAGFAASNIMLFSVSVWSGADIAIRDPFHWISALIAIPAVAFSGRTFFRSAWNALRVGRTNMDVPISIGVLLATAMSLVETVTGGAHAYFDAAVMLLFFLLAGRTLDHLMRERARSAINNLARLAPKGANRIRDDGTREYIALDEIEPGMIIELRAGERVPVDVAALGPGAFDNAVATGESTPVAAEKGTSVPAGAVNIGGMIHVRVERPSTDSFLSRVRTLMEAAEEAKTERRRLADRAAAIYAPVIHAIALSTFVGWGLFGGDWHQALMNATAVLIITCPCALALAVPMVHVVAAGRLMERGVLMKDGAALERIAQIDSVAFDKTGTLTTGTPRLARQDVSDARVADIAAALASASNHPLSRAIAQSLAPSKRVLERVTEVAGRGLEAVVDGGAWRLGSPAWVAPDDAVEGEGVWLGRDGVVVGRFSFEEAVRPEAPAAVGALQSSHLPVRLLSGDSRTPVLAAAAQAGIAASRFALTPQEKSADVAVGKTLMVGDGINDAPAMRAAHASMAPSSAADIGRSAADFIFMGDDLRAVPFVVMTARRAAQIVFQNLTIAIGYNLVAVPLAITGQVTPLIAALAMSSSSLIVVLNALRLRLGERRGAAAASRAHGVGDAAPLEVSEAAQF